LLSFGDIHSGSVTDGAIRLISDVMISGDYLNYEGAAFVLYLKGKQSP